MNESNVVFVMLRKPNLKKPNEMRSDPFWEFGSFGCTKCHRKNLMNPRKLSELNGIRFAFAQGGPSGFKLVHVSPPVETTYHGHGNFGEAKWKPKEMPLTYDSAPLLVNNFGVSDVEGLLEIIIDANRDTPVAKFSSKFRSRREPLPDDVGRRVIEVYKKARRGGAAVARNYAEALPYPPPKIDSDREATYLELRG